MLAPSLAARSSYSQGSLLKATAILGSGSLGTIVVGLAAAKGWAVLVGPSGLGHAALLQGAAGLTGSLAGMGLATSLVRLGPALLASSRQAEFDALVRSAWSLWRWGSFAAIAGLLLWANVIAGWLGGSVPPFEVMLLAIVVAASAATTVQTAVVNAYHQVATLARISVGGSVIGALAGLSLLTRFGASAIVWALVVNSLAMYLVSSWAYRRVHRPMYAVENCPPDDKRRELLACGLPVAVSLLLGTGVQYILPALVAHVVGQHEVGCFRAASTIALNYVGFLFIALGQDYYPRLAAIRGRQTEITATFRQQFHFTMAAGTLLVLGMLSTSQWIIPLCYSRQFSAAEPLLDWYMLGMIFRMASWCMAFLILAYCPAWTVLATEAAVGAVWLGTSWLGLHIVGLSGLGMAFAVTYAVYTLLLVAVVACYIGWVLGWKQWLLLVLAVAATGSVFLVKIHLTAT